MTKEQIERLLTAVERIADALEATVPQNRPPNPRQARFQEDIRKAVKEALDVEKIKVPQK